MPHMSMGHLGMRHLPMEHLGISDMMRAQPSRAEELIAEAGFSAIAMRQQPFVSWRRGLLACRFVWVKTMLLL